MKYKLRVAALALGAVFVGSQLVPIDRSNPPVESDIEAPAEVKMILKRACYDCHSNETEWPWYSHVAPLSWLVAYDVHEGREELNFSTWGKLNAKAQAERLKKTWETVEEGEMPPRLYLPAHPEARLSPQDRETLRVWSGVKPNEKITKASDAVGSGTRRTTAAVQRHLGVGPELIARGILDETTSSNSQSRIR